MRSSNSLRHAFPPALHGKLAHRQPASNPTTALPCQQCERIHQCYRLRACFAIVSIIRSPSVPLTPPNPTSPAAAIARSHRRLLARSIRQPNICSPGCPPPVTNQQVRRPYPSSEARLRESAQLTRQLPSSLASRSGQSIAPAISTADCYIPFVRAYRKIPITLFASQTVPSATYSRARSNDTSTTSMSSSSSPSSTDARSPVAMNRWMYSLV